MRQNEFVRVLQQKLKRTKTKQKLTTSWLFYGDKSEQSIQELCCLRLIFSKGPIISQNLQGRFVPKVDNAIPCINLYQVESGFITPGQKKARSIKGSHLDPFSRTLWLHGR